MNNFRRKIIDFTLLLLLAGLIASCKQSESSTKVQMHPVTSSSIASIGYDGESRTLAIQFDNGRLYYYFDVPMKHYIGLKHADSHGRYFHQHIRTAEFEFEEQ